MVNIKLDFSQFEPEDSGQPGNGGDPSLPSFTPPLTRPEDVLNLHTVEEFLEVLGKAGRQIEENLPPTLPEGGIEGSIGQLIQGAIDKYDPEAIIAAIEALGHSLESLEEQRNESLEDYNDTLTEILGELQEGNLAPQQLSVDSGSVVIDTEPDSLSAGPPRGGSSPPGSGGSGGGGGPSLPGRSGGRGGAGPPRGGSGPPPLPGGAGGGGAGGAGGRPPIPSGAAARTLGALGKLGIVAGSVAGVGVALYATFRKLDDAAKEASEELLSYSPDIMSARVESEMMKIAGRFRQAAAIGDKLAELDIARTELGEEFRELKTAVLDKALPLLIKITEGVTVLVDVAGRILGEAEAANADELAENIAKDIERFFGTPDTNRMLNTMREGIIGVR